jgi:hypothetical protein
MLEKYQSLKMSNDKAQMTNQIRSPNDKMKATNN